YRSGDRTLQARAGPPQGFEDAGGKRRTFFGHHLFPGRLKVPREARAGGLEDPNRGASDLRADAVARDGRDGVGTRRRLRANAPSPPLLGSFFLVSEPPSFLGEESPVSDLAFLR